jgi:hypothetical protein
MGPTLYFGEMDGWPGRASRTFAPEVYALVTKRRPGRRTVMEGLNNNKWLEDIQGAISLEALMEYLELWDIIFVVVLQEGVPDKHIWRLSTTVHYKICL